MIDFDIRSQTFLSYKVGLVEGRCHVHYQFANLTLEGWSAWARLAAPEPFETFTTPTDQVIHVDNQQSASPLEQTRPHIQTAPEYDHQEGDEVGNPNTEQIQREL